MEINRNNILDLCERNNIKPDKDYGQNFLIDPNVSKRIIDLLNIQNSEKILEIGPGLGSLTHFLSFFPNDIDVVDIDYDMVGFLNMVYTNNKNINIILNDIRKHDVCSYDKIVGNLPYNITTEIITYLLINKGKTKRMVLMCQNEAFNHFNDTKGSEYGPTSVLLHLIADIKKEFLVGKGSFYPAPKVESVVFSINFKDENNEDAFKVYKLSKSLFLNRRKTILNNLSRHLNNKEKANEILNKCQIPLNCRPEQLTPDQYFLIYKNI